MCAQKEEEKEEKLSNEINQTVITLRVWTLIFIVCINLEHIFTLQWRETGTN